VLVTVGIDAGNEWERRKAPREGIND